jgi:hypothetical protein
MEKFIKLNSITRSTREAISKGKKKAIQGLYKETPTRLG